MIRDPGKSVARPLFIPLNGEYFDLFESGAKDTEFRKYGPRWNETTCWVGRLVTLSRGYSGRRLVGRIVGFERRRDASQDASNIYGQGVELACIRIELSPVRPQGIPSLSTGHPQAGACKSFIPPEAV
jgi:hypothetical protein